LKLKRLGKILVMAVITLVVLLAAGISLTIGWRPFLGPKARQLTSRQFERTPQRLERGRYLFTAVTGCTGCHSLHDWNTHGGPVLPGGEGVGQVMWFADLPGRIVSSNITPDPETGAGNWTDDQLARAIREGIGHDGRALFPMMPYHNLRYLSDEDLASTIVYMRSLAPVRHELPKTEVIFPVKYLIRSVPEPITQPVSSPDRSDQVKWGQYLVTIGSCNECHTPQDRGAVIPGLEYSGGFSLDGPWGVVASANITPDASGIGYYDEALFIQMMRTGFVRARKLASIMPFGEFKNLTDDDLKAMYAYLRTVKPVKHRVDNSLPPTYCKLCRMKHGAGDQN
jgi:mono/diheme cytochrome c family protein